MVDIDRFKDINDSCGHLVGDAVLREAAWRMRASVRAYDSIGRFGGEEFLVVAPGCGLHADRELAERLRTCIGEKPIISAGSTVAVTISLGVASAAADARTDALLRNADRALYKAKSSGRNRLEIAP